MDTVFNPYGYSFYVDTFDDRLNRAEAVAQVMQGVVVDLTSKNSLRDRTGKGKVAAFAVEKAKKGGGSRKERHMPVRLLRLFSGQMQDRVFKVNVRTSDGEGFVAAGPCKVNEYEVALLRQSRAFVRKQVFKKRSLVRKGESAAFLPLMADLV